MSERPRTSTVRDSFLTLGGLRFHYRDWGDEGAPPLLMLHGLTGHARGWDTVAEALTDRFRVLALDQRGHGESDHATDYTWDRWLGDVEGFAHALALDRFFLIGHSFGGVVAYMYAARHPEAVARLVVVDIGPPPETAGLPPPRGPLAGLRDVFDDPDEALREAQRLDPDARAGELRNGVRHNLLRRDDGRWTLRWDAVLRTPDFLLPLPDVRTQWDALRVLACPTLVIKGAHSTFLPEHAEGMARAIPSARVVEIPAAGHAVHWANPAAFLAVVRAFLLGGPREASGG